MLTAVLHVIIETNPFQSVILIQKLRTGIIQENKVCSLIDGLTVDIIKLQ